MTSPKAVVRRCAIYTRKSSEEGLEQDFNSLHAQREACEAFIKSQQGEGWRLVDAPYDDGGLSGGNMERPALRRLLADVSRGKVDVVVVYKVDRLTRSLADFAKMVEVFDAKGASFVAVTQQFNTTTSMGRLTLNVLLSFAQFEREVTGERIRDKIAASKCKGMWMGGPLPLGYRVEDRKLLVVPGEADRVNEIFRTYLKLGCVRKLKRNLDGRGIRSKARVNQAGKASGGGSFSRGALYALLNNPIYIGEIRHKGVCHPGQHELIVDRSLWEAVQSCLGSQAVRAGVPNRKTESSVLMGKLFDDSGRRLTPSHAIKKGRRYRYYVTPTTQDPSSNAIEWRLPARELERAVTRGVISILGDRATIVQSARPFELLATQLSALLGRAAKLSEGLADPRRLQKLLERAIVKPDGIEVSLALPIDDSRSGDSLRLSRFIPVRMKKRGVEVRMVVGTTPISAQVDRTLLKAIARAKSWLDQLVSGEAPSMAAIARKAGVNEQWVNRGIRFAFLSPEIVQAVLAGAQPPDFTAESILRGGQLEMDWERQKQQLGFVQPFSI